MKRPKIMSNTVKKLSFLFGVLLTILLTFSSQAYATPTTSSPSGYPGPTTTTTAAPNTVNQSLGQGLTGNSLTASSCGFQPNASVTLSLNGTSIGTATSNSSGCVVTTIDVLAVTSTGGQVQINGTKYNVTLTNNELTGVGTGTNGSQLTVNNTFSVATSSSSLSGTTGKPFFGELIGAVSILIIAVGLSVTMLLNRKHQSRQ